jgi:hypothetical protein
LYQLGKIKKKKEKKKKKKKKFLSFVFLHYQKFPQYHFFFQFLVSLNSSLCDKNSKTDFVTEYNVVGIQITLSSSLNFFFEFLNSTTCIFYLGNISPLFNFFDTNTNSLTILFIVQG